MAVPCYFLLVDILGENWLIANELGMAGCFDKMKIPKDITREDRNSPEWKRAKMKRPDM